MITIIRKIKDWYEYQKAYRSAYISLRDYIKNDIAKYQ